MEQLGKPRIEGTTDDRRDDEPAVVCSENARYRLLRETIGFARDSTAIASKQWRVVAGQVRLKVPNLRRSWTTPRPTCWCRVAVASGTLRVGRHLVLFRACRCGVDSGFPSLPGCGSLILPAMGVQDGQATSDGTADPGDRLCRGRSRASRGSTALPGVAALRERHGDPQARDWWSFVQAAGQPRARQARPPCRLAAGADRGQGRPDAGRDRGRTRGGSRPFGASRRGRQMAAPAWPQP